MIEYLLNETVAKKIDEANEYQKKEKTLLRLPKKEEVSKEMVTYVKDGEQIRVESNTVVTDHSIIARNMGVIGNIAGEDIFNEWLISKEVAIKNYGEEIINNLTESFSEHRKVGKIKAILLTGEIMDLLGEKGDLLKIKVDWTDKPMEAKIGDYLTNQGYSISAEDMRKTYEIADKGGVNLESFDNLIKDKLIFFRGHSNPKIKSTNTKKVF
jgi:hypothetical protein